MEPRSAEQIPTPIDYAPSVPSNLEMGADNFAGQRERVAETTGGQLQQVTYAAAPPATAVPLPVPQPIQPAAQPVEDNSPSVASDDDLIEKEWVDKAKQIISSTKDDPHAREQAVVQLQTDYLRKRYGKVLGDNNAA